MITAVTDRELSAEIVDLDSARSGSRQVLCAPTGDWRDARHVGSCSRDVCAGWIARHLLHDLTHHVLDIRRAYARFALDELPGDWNAGQRRR